MYICKDLYNEKNLKNNNKHNEKKKIFYFKTNISLSYVTVNMIILYAIVVTKKVDIIVKIMLYIMAQSHINLNLIML